jgi:mannose-6-phosphate isomerase-like protein (cupin superfamily)
MTAPDTARGNGAQLFEAGQFNGEGNNGWVVGHFIEQGPRRSDDVEVKWMRHAPGPAGKGWSTCETATTLSILLSGHFKIEFRNAPLDSVELITPGQYVIFGPGIHHRSTALKDSWFLTIRWPSTDGNCRPVHEAGSRL